MLQMNIHDAKTHLSSLVERAADGEPFIIAKSGKPMVKVIPYTSAPGGDKRIGFLEGQIKVPEDFDSLCTQEVSSMFEGV